MIKLKYNNPRFVYNKNTDFLMVTNDKYISQYLKQGFEEISRETAEKHRNFETIKPMLGE